MKETNVSGGWWLVRSNIIVAPSAVAELRNPN
jgi:hypothetical protein